MRKLVIALALACAGTQLASGSALLASLFMHAIHRGDDAHAVALVADEGHIDLVLSHGESGEHAHAGAPPHGDRHTSPSETNHVFHLTADDGANTTPRRADVRPASTVAVAARPATAPIWIPRPSPEPRAHSADSPRTVVLRL
ncbi:MAG: hypothetical protein E4H11_07500 [Myxococcales bacterium]|jgi:hypothetical protein|nr:MAG: hypothetical protein E4H11_07500 [Myxococcales bacterium]